MSGDLLSFLAAVRRRLWLEALLRRLHPAVWVASVVLLGAGIVNLAFDPVPWPGAAAVALGAAALVLLPALWSRPPLEQCAPRADRRFGGHSLLTTALEIRRQRLNDRGPAAVAVLRRAEEQTGLWRPRLGSLRQPLPAAGFAVALVPAFAGLVLMQAAPPMVPTERAGPGSVAGSETRLTGPGDLEVARELAAIRDSLQEPSRPSPAATSNTGGPRPRVPGDASPPAGAEVATLADSAVRRPGRATATADAGHEPGDARRAAEDSSRGLAASPLRARPHVDVAIARTGDATAATANSGRGFEESRRPEDDLSRRVQPAAAPPAPDGWTTLTAAEVAYARRYLDAARKARD